MREVDIEKWHDVFVLAQQYKTELGHSDDWALYRDMRRGNFHLPEGFLIYNLVYAMEKVIVPSVYFRNPYFMCSPRYGKGNDVQAKVREAWLNWVVDEINLKQTMKDACQDAYLCGTGPIKLGFDSEFGLPFATTVEGAGDDAQWNKKGDKRVEWNVNVKPGMPWALRVDPDQILTPFGVRSSEDFEWVDHVYFRQLQDVKQCSLYKNTKDLAATHVASSHFLTNKQEILNKMESKVDWVELHEVRDRRTGMVFVMAPVGGGGYTIIREPDEDVLQIEGLPFVFLQWNRDSEVFWCPSDVRLFESQQHEMNEARTQSMEHRKISLFKLLVRAGLFDQEAMEKFRSGKVGMIAEVNSANIAGDVLPITPHIPPDTIAWIDKLKEDVREIVGIGRNQLGDMDKSSRKTATEVEVVNSANQLRMSDRQDSVADAVRDVGRKLLQIGMKFSSTSQIVRVVGYDAATYWVEVSKDDLAGEFDIKVDVDSMTPNTKRMRRQEIIQLIQAVGNNPRANVDYLMRMLLREFDWVDALKVLPEAAPMPGMEGAAGGALPYQAYQQGQQKLLSNPKMLQDRVTENAGKVGSRVGVK